MTEAEAKVIVRERDGDRCRDCGRTDADFQNSKRSRLEVHRLVPGSVYTPEGCVLLCARCHRKRHKRPDATSIRLNKQLVQRVRVMAIAERVALPALMNRLLEPLVDRDYPEALKALGIQA